MAQTQVNINRLVDTINKTNAYTPIVEAVVNSIDSIDESNRKDGEIIVTLIRDSQRKLLKEDKDELQPISSITITDNGVGFNEKNFDAFNTIYTDIKIKTGGKGFGRFVYLKYFDDVGVESIYNGKGVYFKKTFKFVKQNNIIQDETEEEVEDQELITTIRLDGIKRQYLGKLDKKVDTVARKLLEKLLFYFVIDGYSCPKIKIREDNSNTEIVLNDYLVGDNKEISKIDQKEFVLVSQDKSVREKFNTKIFKIFYGESRSSINLVADKRKVTEEALYNYVPEFKDDFYDETTNDKGEKVSKNYTIKIYVQGKYLDENVSLERDAFEFQTTSDLYHPLSKSEIEREAATLVADKFGSEVKTRRDRKESRIKEYVDTKAPWHKSYLLDLDLSEIPYDFTDSDIEIELQKVKHRKELLTKAKIEKVLEKSENDIEQNTSDLIQEITEIGKSDLAHYVALRRTVLNLFKKSLTWGEDHKFEKEKVIHNIIFPTKHSTDSISYDDHNLWILDEKLSFTEYLSSDLPLNTNDERPDLLVFDKRISFRTGEELSNPIIVFEFKRPQRNEYDSDDNPLKQISGYVEKIRTGNFKNPKGRNINANKDTPAYGFVICDLTPKIRGFCKEYSLFETPDNKGYIGFHPQFRIYFEVMSFDKIAEDSELRNNVFFKKLGLE